MSKYDDLLEALDIYRKRRDRLEFIRSHAYDPVGSMVASATQDVTDAEEALDCTFRTIIKELT